MKRQIQRQQQEQQRNITDLGEHVLLFEGFCEDEFIDFVLSVYQKCEDRGLTLPRKSYDTQIITSKADDAISITSVPESYFGGQMSQLLEIFEAEGGVIDNWFEKYPVQDNYRGLMVSGAKIQKTLPQQGYHVWHCEHCNCPSSSKSLLAWAIFLNDVEEGGELEFLYQSLRIKPKRGDIVLWPAGFTHMHRGNPPLKGEKKIITGWIDYA